MGALVSTWGKKKKGERTLWPVKCYLLWPGTGLGISPLRGCLCCVFVCCLTQRVISPSWDILDVKIMQIYLLQLIKTVKKKKKRQNPPAV